MGSNVRNGLGVKNTLQEKKLQSIYRSNTIKYFQNFK